MTLAAAVRRAAARLAEREAPEQNAALDAEVLARHVLGWDRAQWIAGNRDTPPPAFESRFTELLDRRLQGEPVAYLTGTREFWGLDFEVSPAVLIPRPETELLVERALAEIDLRAGPEGPRHRRPEGPRHRTIADGGAALFQGPRLTIADVGTGSGCVAIALAHERPALRIIATDISERALDVARRNAERHGVDRRIDFRLTPVLEGVGHVDLVVSNPPYVATGAAAGMMTDVRDYEPHSALFSGADGLHVIRALLADIRQRDPAPPLLFEFGGNEPDVREAVSAAGLRVRDVIRDLAGIPRIAIVER